MIVMTTMTTNTTMRGAMTLGETIARLRDQRGWSQGMLAVRSGMKPTQISRIERDVHKTINARNLARLADALSVSADYILTEVGWLTAKQDSIITPMVPEQRLLNTIRAIDSPHIRHKVLEQLTRIAETVLNVEKAEELNELNLVRKAAERRTSYQEDK